MGNVTDAGTETKRAGFRSKNRPTWCPGCGDFGVLGALDRALTQLGVAPHDVAIVAGIGCSSRFPFFMDTYGFHSAHGRGLAVATGLKAARPNLTVVATGGDGDALAIGGNHFFHTMRRNVDLTYILMDNQIYGMTKGQTAPTSRRGLKTKSTPRGNIEEPVNPAWAALTAGATFVAQGTSFDMNSLAEMLLAGLRHRGMSFVNVLSPCVTFHREADKQYFKDLSSPLPEGHDPTSYPAALRLLDESGDQHPLGIIYQERDGRAPYGDDVDALLDHPTNERAVLEQLLRRYF
ncbi:MAG: 2-oxoacid:ferredoxin oxidoreductase subunit beta [Polyangiaceae bacterium]|nr:2-oxoacid:ferredoxin oxidoreductase subunit beta [Polyangiaceae bacterium]